jgi:hypothetical protein
MHPLHWIMGRDCRERSPVCRVKPAEHDQIRVGFDIGEPGCKRVIDTYV